MKIKISIILFLLTTQVFAAEIYPSKLPLRLEGLDQQNVGSCMAEADTNAIEYYFAEKGISQKVSSFYRHAKRWVDNGKEAPAQPLTDADQKFLKNGPPIVPLFMYPEDSQGLPRSPGRQRPSLQAAAVMSPHFPNGTEAFKFKEDFFTFASPKTGKYSNFITLEEIKAKINQRLPLTMSIHSELLYHFDDYTGLLNWNYSFAELKKEFEPGPMEESQSHRIAIVGYDDSLYAEQNFPKGPGALIIVNSWNDAGDFESMRMPPTDEQLVDLKKMRLKINERNLPGYYAIPYQYIYDLQNEPVNDPDQLKGFGGIVQISFDANHFVSVTTQVAPTYKVYNIPFVCDRLVLESLFYDLDDIENLKQNNPALGKKQYLRLIQDNLGRPNPFHFSRSIYYAKLSHNTETGVNRMDDFVQGKLASYYCESEGLNFFPNQDDMSDPNLQTLMSETIVEPSAGLLHGFFQWIYQFKGV